MIATYTSFNILDQLDVKVRIDENPFKVELTDLFEMGARVNPKRSFLFVSKLIGKHLDVHPDVPKATGYLLANLLAKHLNGKYFSKDMDQFVDLIKTGVVTKELKAEFENRHLLSDATLFIGFAETATGLGHSVYSAFDNAFFVHTTREELISVQSIFDFKEEHSHAVDHRCYLMDDRWINNAEQIVLIDDEMTTGKTTLNLIRSLHAKFPKKKYIVLSLLDWRTKEEEDAYVKVETELGVEIVTLSLIRGEIEVEKDVFFSYQPTDEIVIKTDFRVILSKKEAKVTQVHELQGEVSYLADTGRFGMMSLLSDFVEENCRETGEELRNNRKGEKTLVLGIGEFMYLPSRIASYMGEGVTHKTTTRSPIYPSSSTTYPIYERIAYKDDNDIQYYMYNMSGKYDEVFMMFESEPSDRLKNELASLLKQKGIKHISFVVL
jgi:hypothetical protein